MKNLRWGNKNRFFFAKKNRLRDESFIGSRLFYNLFVFQATVLCSTKKSTTVPSCVQLLKRGCNLVWKWPCSWKQRNTLAFSPTCQGVDYLSLLKIPSPPLKTKGSYSPLGSWPALQPGTQKSRGKALLTVIAFLSTPLLLTSVSCGSVQSFKWTCFPPKNAFSCQEVGSDFFQKWMVLNYLSFQKVNKGLKVRHVHFRG